MTTKTIPLDKITIDGGTQARAALNEDVVAEYAEAIIGGANMPPVVVFQDGKKFWLADGFHRYHAHRKARAAAVDAEVRTGTRRDAILHSVGANAAHGLRRTNADKRCAVQTLLSDKEWGTWSDRHIADACGVSHPFVAALRNPERAAKQQAHREAAAGRKVESDSTATPPAGGHDEAPNASGEREEPARDAAPSAAHTAPSARSDEPPASDPQPPPQAGQPEGDLAPDGKDGSAVEDADGEAETELEAARRQIEELTDLLQAFDTVEKGEREAAQEIARLHERIRVVESQRDDYMRTCNEIKRQVTALQRENKRLLARIPTEAP